MEETNKKSGIDFRELPNPVRDWLSSSQITYLVSDLNRRLGFTEEEKMRVIPTLILRLAIATLTPEAFTNELAKLLDLSPSSAKTLAQEIEEKMLRPMENALRNELGIDIKLIHFGSVTAELQKPPSPAPIQTENPKPTLIASPEVAHPGEALPRPSAAPLTPQRIIPSAQPAAPSYPPVMNQPARPAEPAPQPPRPTPPPVPEPPKVTPVPFKVSKTPTWGENRNWNNGNNNR